MRGDRVAAFLLKEQIAHLRPVSMGDDEGILRETAGRSAGWVSRCSGTAPRWLPRLTLPDEGVSAEGHECDWHVRPRALFIGGA